MKKGKLNVAVVGASGMVGGEMLALLEKRNFPVGEFYPFNSGRKPAVVKFRGKKYPCLKPTLEALKKADLVFFASNDEVSEKFAPALAAAGVWCIDDSSRFRLAKNVPLVIPEVNACELSPDKKLVAGPNCTLTGAAVALAEIHRKYRITELRLATYQAVSGAGKAAMVQLKEELKAYFRTGKVAAAAGPFPRPIAFNVFPQVGDFDADGHSGEENKVEAELKKIWRAPGLRVSSVAVRVPVLRGHSLGIWAKTAKPWTPAALRAVLAKTKGLKFYRDHDEYPTPLTHGIRTPGVSAGRLRKAHTSPNEFQLWAVSDNLYIGAAFNSVQIAEGLLERGYL